jgi:dTMP kinase
MPKRGKLIILEGLDGSGTTTLTKNLLRKLKENGIDSISTFEPSDSPVGLLLREYLKGNYTLMDWRAMSMLFTADRYDHCTHIENRLQQGTWVVCDRYRWSTYAYQTASAMEIEGKGLEGYKKQDARNRVLGWLKQINDAALTPDMTIFLDAEPKVALARIDNDRKESREIYEKEAFLEIVSNLYIRLVHTSVDAGRICPIDAAQPIETVVEECWAKVKRHLL